MSTACSTALRAASVCPAARCACTTASHPSALSGSASTAARAFDRASSGLPASLKAVARKMCISTAAGPPPASVKASANEAAASSCFPAAVSSSARARATSTLPWPRKETGLRVKHSSKRSPLELRSIAVGTKDAAVAAPMEAGKTNGASSSSVPIKSTDRAPFAVIAWATSSQLRTPKPRNSERRSTTTRPCMALRSDSIDGSVRARAGGATTSAAKASAGSSGHVPHLARIATSFKSGPAHSSTISPGADVAVPL
mmetsp:Transcript_156395/g.501723  ORF Transcript_156395/g.501723 Transcript_156395/m.501723 type:complete len:257 (+) Transcript_156395:1877-2647(+)